jgi:hypothetical protein
VDKTREAGLKKDRYKRSSYGRTRNKEKGSVIRKTILTFTKSEDLRLSWW